MGNTGEHRYLFAILAPALIEGLPNEDVCEALLGYFLERVIGEVTVQEQSDSLAIPVETDLRNEELHAAMHNLIVRQLQLPQEPHILFGGVEKGRCQPLIDLLPQSPVILSEVSVDPA